MTIIARPLLFFAAILVSAQSIACTLCHSPIAEEVRARLFDTDFQANLAMVAAPALILFGAIFYSARKAPSERKPL